MAEPIDLNISPLGVDNVSHQRADSFQPPMQPGDKPAMLREAVNVDLDRDGNLSRRRGRTKLLDLTDAHSGTSIGGMVLLADDGNLKRIYPGEGRAETLVFGIGSDEVIYAQLGNEVYWLSSSARGRLSSQSPTFWGLASPDGPALAETTGALDAGRYLVALTVEAGGIESGSHGSTPITVGEGAGIQITAATGIDSRAEFVNVYCSECNGRDLFWVETVAAGQPIVIDRVGVSLDLLDGLGAYPPPTGQIVREFSGRMLVASGDTLYWSMALAPHRFRLGADLQAFPSRIVLLEPTIDGFYVSCEDSATWFISGTDPDEWRPIEVANCPTCEGTAVKIEGHKLPWAQTDAVCLVWATRDGWCAGLPGGVVKFPTSGRIAMDTQAKATLAFREEDGLRQIMLSMRDKRAVSRFGASDRATATIIKADGTIQ